MTQDSKVGSLNGPAIPSPLGAGAMTGVRVVEMAAIGAGPYLGSLLGDLGADVIKIEPPGGEPFRNTDNHFAEGESSYFFAVNRSKRSLVLDLKSQDGRQFFHELIRTTDVVIVTMRPSVVTRLGLDYETLSAVNPRLVFCEISAFGESGPRAEEPGMDILAQAIGGVMGTTGEPGRAPVKAGPPIADFATSYLGGFAICAALLARTRTGVGQKVSLNLLDSTVALMANYVTPYFKTGVPIRPVGGGHPQLVPYQVFSASDGYFVVACLSDRFWLRLCDAIDRPDLAAHPDYRTNGERVRSRDQLIGELAPIFAGKTKGEWLDLLRAHEVPCSPVNLFEEVFDDPQVKHNRMLFTLVHPVFGAYEVANNPIRMSHSTTAPHAYAPRLGEHNSEIREELEPRVTRPSDNVTRR
jgi:crotonobetainyl-CoA:carnitine CoA-transferase CaiB-like acyl-CoA transferase